MATIKIEGQTLPMDDELARDDELLRTALTATWPDAKNAKFERSGGKDGKELVVVVTKKAGTKGMDDSELATQAMFDRIKARQNREAERVGKLEDVALAADDYMRVHWEFDGDPASVGEHANALGVAVERLGEGVIDEIRNRRRSA